MHPAGRSAVVRSIVALLDHYKTDDLKRVAVSVSDRSIAIDAIAQWLAGYAHDEQKGVALIVPRHEHARLHAAVARGQTIEELGYPGGWQLFNPINNENCIQADAATRLIVKGYSVRRILCWQCPARPHCMYLGQEEQPHPLYIYPDWFLRAAQPYKARLIIVDGVNSLDDTYVREEDLRYAEQWPGAPAVRPLLSSLLATLDRMSHDETLSGAALIERLESDGVVLPPPNYDPEELPPTGWESEGYLPAIFRMMTEELPKRLRHILTALHADVADRDRGELVRPRFALLKGVRSWVRDHSEEFTGVILLRPRPLHTDARRKAFVLIDVQQGSPVVELLREMDKQVMAATQLTERLLGTRARHHRDDLDRLEAAVRELWANGIWPNQTAIGEASGLGKFKVNRFKAELALRVEGEWRRVGRDLRLCPSEEARSA